MAALPIYIDTVTGRLRKSESDDSEVALRAVIQGDKLDVELRTVANDALTTSTDLADGAALAVTLKRRSTDTTVLSQVTSYSLEGEIASATVNLSSTTIDAAFDAVNVSELHCWIEFSLTAPSSAYINAFQYPIALRRSLST